MVKCFFCNEAEAEVYTAYEVKMYKIQSTEDFDYPQISVL